MPYKNKQDHLDRCKAYYNSPEGRKKHRIKAWKRYGVISDDWDALFECFMAQTNCWICNVEFNSGNRNTWKTLDHDHETGEPRYICCKYCNLNVIC